MWNIDIVIFTKSSLCAHGTMSSSLKERNYDELTNRLPKPELFTPYFFTGDGRYGRRPITQLTSLA